MVALFLLVSVLEAQGLDGYIVPGVETGNLQMNVHVWGEVISPGTYMLPIDADVVEALSEAGGPSDKAKLDGIRIITSWGEVDYDLAAYLRGEGLPAPALTPGTTVFVPVSRSDWWKEALDIVYKIIVTVNLVWLMAER